MDHVLPRELEHAVFTIRDHLHINFSAGFKKQRKKSASYKYVSDCIRKKNERDKLDAKPCHECRKVSKLLMNVCLLSKHIFCVVVCNWRWWCAQG